jgi:hypothetical protein
VLTATKRPWGSWDYEQLARRREEEEREKEENDRMAEE